MARNSSNRRLKTLAKTPTGIVGLDQITNGGLPRGRTTVIVGGPGSGKTVISAEFLVRGVEQYGEPGVAMVFEESAEEYMENMASLGFDVPGLIKSGKLVVDHVHIDRREIEETGEYDLAGLFIRLGHAIDSIKAKRVTLDTAELLFSGLQNTGIVRAELQRLFRWLKEKGVTSILTSESGEASLTRYGLEEYVADCVVMLDHRVDEQISTRRIRVLKYRGSTHGTNEFPFLISPSGICVMPITSVGLDHEASTERVSTGIAGLDEMLGTRGFYRGSSILVSGTAGTGKSIIAAHFANAACARGERALYFAFEESPSQILRNMRSVGLNLEQWMRKKLLTIHAVRPTSTGLENHLVTMNAVFDDVEPNVVVVDPITNLISVGEEGAVKSMLTRLIDLLKMKHITAMFTNLSHPSGIEETSTAISSLMDAWLLLREVEEGLERKRLISVLKSRGMAHSNQVRQVIISDNGIDIVAAEEPDPHWRQVKQGKGHGQQEFKKAFR